MGYISWIHDMYHGYTIRTATNFFSPGPNQQRSFGSAGVSIIMRDERGMSEMGRRNLREHRNSYCTN